MGSNGRYDDFSVSELPNRQGSSAGSQFLFGRRPSVAPPLFLFLAIQRCSRLGLVPGVARFPKLRLDLVRAKFDVWNHATTSEWIAFQTFQRGRYRVSEQTAYKLLWH